MRSGVSATLATLVALVALAEATVWTGTAHASDGPAIGVLLHRAPSALTISTRPEYGLIVEVKKGRKLLPPGVTKLQFSGATARLGGIEVTRMPFRLRAEKRAPTGVAGCFYEGWIEVLPEGHDRIIWKVVNRLPLERYLVGVLAREMPESFHPAALEAQAIASRTFAMYQILRRPPDARHHVRDDTRSQVYGGITESDKVRRAVERTRGQVLLYDGKVFEAFFHSTCGGATFDGAAALGAPNIEPLHAVPCGYCKDSRFWSWEDQRIPEAGIRAAVTPLCREHGIEVGPIRAIEPLERGPGGHASYVRIVHDGGSFEMDAIRFRLRLIGAGHSRLRSTAFRCSKDGADFVFSGSGWGHGVGMCQFGVNGLARQGYDGVGIVEYYYRGAGVFELWR